MPPTPIGARTLYGPTVVPGARGMGQKDYDPASGQIDGRDQRVMIRAVSVLRTAPCDAPRVGHPVKEMIETQQPAEGRAAIHDARAWKRARRLLERAIRETKPCIEVAAEDQRRISFELSNQPARLADAPEPAGHPEPPRAGHIVEVSRDDAQMPRVSVARRASDRGTHGHAPLT